MDADNRTPDQQVEEQLADAFKKGTLVYLP
jgi:hypothetical protein